MSNRKFAFALAALLAVGLLVPAAGSSRSAATALVGTVGPGFSITLQDSSGAVVKHLDPGAYTITVHDLSDGHNFHLVGPGVSQSTGVEFAGDVTWEVTVTDGKYSFKCDVHPSQMNGSFTVGTVTTPPPASKLVGTVGPRKSISLKTSSGAKATSVAAGSYKITVKDRSKTLNFHLTGAGVNKRTARKFRGTVTWSVKLQAGKTYTYKSDKFAAKLRGKVKVT